MQDILMLLSVLNLLHVLFHYFLGNSFPRYHSLSLPFLPPLSFPISLTIYSQVSLLSSTDGPGRFPTIHSDIRGAFLHLQQRVGPSLLLCLLWHALLRVRHPSPRHRMRQHRSHVLPLVCRGLSLVVAFFS